MTLGIQLLSGVVYFQIPTTHRVWLLRSLLKAWCIYLSLQISATDESSNHLLILLVNNFLAGICNCVERKRNFTYQMKFFCLFVCFTSSLSRWVLLLLTSLNPNKQCICVISNFPDYFHENIDLKKVPTHCLMQNFLEFNLIHNLSFKLVTLLITWLIIWV